MDLKHDEPWLSPREVSERYRREFGAPLAVSYLAKLRTIGGGPLFTKQGYFCVYQWSDVLAWANSRRSKPVRSTSELSAA